jgi:hypothetical protein
LSAPTKGVSLFLLKTTMKVSNTSTGTRRRKPTGLTALALLAAVFAGFVPQVRAQAATMADLAKLDPAELGKVLAANPPLFIKVVGKASKWNEPSEPVKIAGPIYFVGTQGLSV